MCFAFFFLMRFFNDLSYMNKAQRGSKASIYAVIIGPWYLRGNQWGFHVYLYMLWLCTSYLLFPGARCEH